MLSSSCFIPASLMPQSLPPTVPSIAKYLSGSRDVHACSVVPDKEWLPGFLGIVPIKEVDDFGGDFLVDCF